jgi:hypothetical protein
MAQLPASQKVAQGRLKGEFPDAAPPAGAATADCRRDAGLPSVPLGRWRRENGSDRASRKKRIFHIGNAMKMS